MHYKKITSHFFPVVFKLFFKGKFVWREVSEIVEKFCSFCWYKGKISFFTQKCIFNKLIPTSFWSVPSIISFKHSRSRSPRLAVLVFLFVVPKFWINENKLNPHYFYLKHARFIAKQFCRQVISLLKVWSVPWNSSLFVEMNLDH